MPTFMNCIIQATLPWFVVRFSHGRRWREEAGEVRVFVSCRLPAAADFPLGYSSYAGTRSNDTTILPYTAQACPSITQNSEFTI